jgi:hypothetical protein
MSCRVALRGECVCYGPLYLRSLCTCITAKSAINVFKSHWLRGQAFDTRSNNYVHETHFMPIAFTQSQCILIIWKFKYFIVHGGRELGKANRESDRLIYVYTRITYHIILIRMTLTVFCSLLILYFYLN